MNLSKTAPVIALAATLSAPSLAQVETESTFRQATERLYQEPGEFTVNSNADVEVVNFKSPRDVRLCLPDTRHVVPLEIEYDDRKTVLQPGNCTVVEAKEVAISTAGDLKDGWALHGTFETVRRAK